jgi:hypothetical protein
MMSEAKNTETKPYLEMSVQERRIWIRGLMEDGTYPYQKNISVEDIIENGLTYRDPEWDYYRYRVQLEGVDPALAAKYVQTCNSARFFMDAYGLERSKPYLSSYLWIYAYHSSVGKFENNAQTKRDIGLLIADRGADLVCEEIRSRNPAEINIMMLLKHWGESFVDILGHKAVSGLPPALANKIKGVSLEEALGL